MESPTWLRPTTSFRAPLWQLALLCAVSALLILSIAARIWGTDNGGLPLEGICGDDVSQLEQAGAQGCVVRKAARLEHEAGVPLMLIGAGFTLLVGGSVLLVRSRVRVVSLEEAATYARLPIAAAKDILTARHIGTYSRRGHILVALADLEALRRIEGSD